MGAFSEASLITRATNDIQQIQMVLVMCMRMVLFAPCMGVGAVAKVVGFGSTGLQWIIVVGLVVISVVIGLLMALTMPKFRRMQDLVDRNNLVAREIITGIMPIRAFGRSASEEERYDEANRALTGTYIFTNRAMSFMMPVMMMIMNVISIAIVWFGGHGVDAGTMQVGDLMAYMNYTMQVIMSFMIITMVAVMLPRADIASERVQAVLATTSSVADPASSMTGAQRHMTADGEELPWTGVLSFDDVSFAYPGAEEPTIEHVTFTVRPGQTLGVIGSTGVGKSTLVQLIPRLYDATEGSVTVDGVDVRRMDLKELRSVIGYVPQKGMLFSGDIASNIAYGDPDLPDERIERARAHRAGGGFHRGEARGLRKPDLAGRHERLGRAAPAPGDRARPGDRPQDPGVRRQLLGARLQDRLRARAALAREARGSAVVIVAQRVATIMHADQIIVLDDGRGVGQGTHDELLRTCDAYREIAMSQLSSAELGLDEGRCANVPGPMGHGRGPATEKAKDLKGALLGLVRYLAHDWPIVLISLACAVGSVAFNVTGPARAGRGHHDAVRGHRGQGGRHRRRRFRCCGSNSRHGPVHLPHVGRPEPGAGLAHDGHHPARATACAARSSRRSTACRCRTSSA